jgi:uncharacterized membrane protein YhfC
VRVYALAMRRVLVLAAVIGFALWRARRFDESDRAQGFGAYAKVVPVTDD